MRRIMLKAKIHRARVTQTDLDYEGSLTLDANLMDAADMLPYEQIHIYNITNGERFLTYLIKGEIDSGVVGINGAAAHRAQVGDELIIATYTVLAEEKTDYFMPKIILVDEKNRVKHVEQK
jgi:aspartate 1-decarboxylase